MTRRSAHGLTTHRGPDWRDEMACREEDPELFFPKGYEGPWALVIAQAKAVCNRCPVREQCLQFALDEGIKDGIFGALTAEERVSFRRSTVRRARTHRIEPGPKLPPAATLEEAFQRRTRRTDDGHVLWQGHSQIKFQNVVYNALRVAFAFGHGRDPEGRVERTCGRVCFEPHHLVDDVMRNAGALCGSRPGYAWHRKAGEPACDACKRANADGDNRLRRTGSSKVLAS